MFSRYIEFSGKLYKVYSSRVQNEYITEIMDNGLAVASLKMKEPAGDEQIKGELQKSFEHLKKIEVGD